MPRQKLTDEERTEANKKRLEYHREYYKKNRESMLERSKECNRVRREENRRLVNERRATPEQLEKIEECEAKKILTTGIYRCGQCKKLKGECVEDGELCCDCWNDNQYDIIDSGIYEKDWKK